MAEADAKSLQAENRRLRQELDEARQTLEAIRSGEVDGLVVGGSEGDRIYTLEGSDFAYRALVEQMEEGAATLNRCGTVLYANRSLAALLQRPLETVIGAEFVGFLCPEDQAEFGRMLDACAGPGATTRAPIVLQAEGGTRVPVSVALQAFDVYGAPTLAMTVIDLTEHRALARVEAEREGEERYRLAIAATQDAIWDIDLATGAVRWNDAYEEAFGRPADAGEGWQWWIDHLHPDDRDGAVETLRDALAGTGNKWSREYRFLRLDGGWAHILDRAFIARDEAGRATRAIGAMMDLTERKRGEEALRETQERLRSVLENATDVVYRLDLRTGRYDYISPSAARVIGVPAEELMARTPEAILERIHPDDREALMAAVRRLDVEGESEAEYRLQTGPDEYRWLSNRMFLGRDEDGKPRFRHGTIRDITERKRTEAQLRDWSADLERRVAERTGEVQTLVVRLRALAIELTNAERQERQKLARVLHDHLQQMLVAAKLQVGVLRGQVREELRSAAVQADALLADCIQASRNLAIELSPPVLQESGLVAGLDWLRRRMKDQHNLEVDLAAEPGTEPGDEGVRAFVFEAVRELLFNVVKHSGVTRARLVVRRSNDDLEVVVEDEGSGTDASARKSPGTDSGFGLFSIGQRLEVFGGGMSFQSRAGQGTRVSLRVPLAPFAIPQRESPPAAPLTPAVPSSRIRILLADDHPVIRQGLATLLRTERDMDVVGEASDGVQAIALARALRPDVIVMDVGMPGTNGVEATRQIVRDTPDVRVVGLSMHEGADQVAAMRGAGAVGYVTKGGPSDALVDAIRMAAHPPKGTGP